MYITALDSAHKTLSCPNIILDQLVFQSAHSNVKHFEFVKTEWNYFLTQEL